MPILFYTPLSSARPTATGVMRQEMERQLNSSPMREVQSPKIRCKHCGEEIIDSASGAWAHRTTGMFGCKQAFAEPE